MTDIDPAALMEVPAVMPLRRAECGPNHPLQATALCSRQLLQSAHLTYSYPPSSYLRALKRSLALPAFCSNVCHRSPALGNSLFLSSSIAIALFLWN